MRISLLFAAVLIVIIAIIVSGCSSREPVRIGFAGELTGINSSLSVDGRDGALLAVDHINAAGGVAGRPIELVVRDDKGAPEVARQVDAELAQQGVVAIIGHYTSSQTKAVIDQTNAAGIVLISPTTTSADFTNQDDYFFRVIPDNNGIGKNLASHMFLNRKVRTLVSIYDLRNRAYTETVWKAVNAEFTRLGGKEIAAIRYSSENADYKALAAEAANLPADGVVFIASSIDAALMIQYYQQVGGRARLYAVPWAQTSEFLEKGGRAIEGVELTTFYDADSSYPPFQKFIEAFEKRYHRLPGFSAAYSYEAVITLAEALRRTDGSSKGLKTALTGIRNFQGVLGMLTINATGDVHRDIYVAVVENGRFRVIETMRASQ